MDCAEDDRGVTLIKRIPEGLSRGIPRFAKDAKHGTPFFVERDGKGGPPLASSGRARDGRSK